MNTRFYAPARQIDRMCTAELRDQFLLEHLFEPGEMRLAYLAFDRLMIGGLAPRPAITVLASDDTQRSFFNPRRESGLINIGQTGLVTVDGADFEVGHLECLYVGSDAREISVRSIGSGISDFYVLSCPAHKRFPTRLARRCEALVSEVGDSSCGSKRTVTRYIHEGGLKSCQLVMGFTELEQGSVWNTWPPHTHLRRSEVYLYFDLTAEPLFHMIGEADSTRHLVVRNRQAVLSPPWSIHTGVGTGQYRFIWGMAGENQTFEDVDPVKLDALK